MKNYHSILIGGHALELNFSCEINILLSVRQMRLLSGLLMVFNEMYLNWSGVGTYQPLSDNPPGPEREAELNASESSSAREVDSGIESGTGTSLNPVRKQQREVEGTRVPLDIFLAAPFVRITTYHLLYSPGKKGETSLEQDLASVVGVTPLAVVLIGQPYFVISTSVYAQRIEFSFFDLSVGLGHGKSRKSTCAMVYLSFSAVCSRVIFSFSSLFQPNLALLNLNKLNVYYHFLIQIYPVMLKVRFL